MNNRYWVDIGYINGDNIQLSYYMKKCFETYNLAKDYFEEIKLNNREYKSILQESKNNVMFLYQLDYEERRDTNE